MRALKKTAAFPLLPLLLIFLAGFPPSPLQGRQPSAQEREESKKSPSSSEQSLNLALHYLQRESAVEKEDYARVKVYWRSGEQLLNPVAGVETRMRDSQVRTYFLGNDFKIDERSTVHLRWNHTEYGDWETGINHLNLFYSYERPWLRLAAGFGYVALQFGDKYYRDPTNFNTDATESRFIYEVSLRPRLWRDRLRLELGFENYDDFEYHGFDDTGYHLQPIFKLNEKTVLSLFYERRYAAAFISVPTLVRTTWRISLERRF